MADLKRKSIMFPICNPAIDECQIMRRMTIINIGCTKNVNGSSASQSWLFEKIQNWPKITINDFDKMPVSQA